MNNDSFPIKDTWVLNPLELATHIENVMGRYMLAPDQTTDTARQAIEQFPMSRASFAIVSPRGIQIERPPIPYLGMAIILTYIENVIEESSAWSRRARCNFIEAMAPYLKPEWRHTEEVYEHLRNMLIDIRTDVRVFLGPDRWIMHFVRTRGFDIYIEKSVDFRIYDWMRRHDAGEF